jgi:hypothetical protein
MREKKRSLILLMIFFKKQEKLENTIKKYKYLTFFKNQSLKYSSN